MCTCPRSLMSAYQPSPLATKLQVKRLLPTVSVVEYSKSPWPIYKTNPTLMPGERSRFKLRKSRISTATPTSMEWTSQETSTANLLRNGTHSLKLLFKLRLLMDTCSDCSLLVSLRELRSRLRPLAMPRDLRKSKLERRWWKLWSMRCRSPPWRNWPRNLSRSPLANKSRRSAQRSSPLTTFSWKKLSFSRSPSSISQSWWSSIKRDQKLRREPKRKRNQRTSSLNEIGVKTNDMSEARFELIVWSYF